MYKTVKDSISCSRVSIYHVVAVVDRQLGYDDSGFSAVSFLDDFHKVKQLQPIKDIQAKVIDNE